jgi:hypothetical protein
MNATSEFNVLLKQNASTLHKAFKLALHPTDSLNQLETNIKVPSLQQCNEILSHAYGFNTYNGSINPRSDHKEFTFNSKLLNESIRLFLLREATKDSSGLFNLIDLISNTDRLASIINDVDQVYNFIEAFPTILNLNQPKFFHANEFKFDWHLMVKSPFINKFSEITFDLFLSLLIENLDSVEIYEEADSTILVAPISVFFKHKVSDIYKVKDIVIDLEDLLNSSGILRVESGALDFIEHHHSKIQINMSTALAKNLQMIARFNKNKESAIYKLDRVLDVYVRHFGTAFQHYFEHACLEHSPRSKLSELDKIKYQIKKRLYFSTLLSELKLHQEVHACTTSIVGLSSISDLDKKLVFESVYFNDAITLFDDRYGQKILPILNEYIKYKKELISLLKPHINDIAKNHDIPLPTEILVKLNEINSNLKKERFLAL